MGKYITISQEPGKNQPLKLGVQKNLGYGAYAVDGNLFVKRLKYYPNMTYPDRGASLEVFTSGNMLELESLGPLVTLKQYQETTHTEKWELYKIPKIEPKEPQIDGMFKQIDFSP
jgi:hypothetical protein